MELTDLLIELEWHVKSRITLNIESKSHNGFSAPTYQISWLKDASRMDFETLTFNSEQEAIKGISALITLKQNAA